MKDQQKAPSGFIKLAFQDVAGLGLDSAILMAYLEFRETYWAKSEGWFFVTREKLKEEVGLSKFKVKQAENLLFEKGAIETELRGMPARTHYRINHSVLASIRQAALSGEVPDGQTSTQDSEYSPPVGEKLANIKEGNRRTYKEDRSKERTDGSSTHPDVLLNSSGGFEKRPARNQSLEQPPGKVTALSRITTVPDHFQPIFNFWCRIAITHRPGSKVFANSILILESVLRGDFYLRKNVPPKIYVNLPWWKSGLPSNDLGRSETILIIDLMTNRTSKP